MYTFLRNYRATPHSTTIISPAEALFGRKIKPKLPQGKEEKKNRKDIHTRDQEAKLRMKSYADQSNKAKES